MRLVMMMTAVAFATPSLAAESYDMACSSDKINVRYHVDIERGKWCVDECRSVQAIAQINADEVLLVKHRILFTNRPAGEITINAATGSWRLFKTYPYRNDPLVINGTCKREPFTILDKVAA